MGLGGGRKVSRRGLIIIAALLFGIALSSRHSIGQNQIRSVAPQPNILAMLSKKPTSGQLRRDMARNTASSAGIGITVAARNNAVAGKNLTIPGQLSTIRRAGMLHADETWQATKTYIIDSEVTVLDGVTLTIQAGTVIKIVGPGSGIHVQQGGKLIANGTTEDPVYITSYRNDVVGGNTSTGMIRAGVGDYLTALTLDGGSLATLSNTRISYAEVGIVVSGNLNARNLAIGRTNNAITSYGGQTVLTDMLMSNNGTTMLVRGGEVIMRGVIRSYSAKSIQACDWMSDQCSVDAAYVSWQEGDVSAGSTACGQVLLSAELLSASRNCSGDRGFPNLSAASMNLQSRLDAIASDCLAQGQDPCDALMMANGILDSRTAALSNMALSLPQGPPSNRPMAWADQLETNTRTYFATRVGPDAEPLVFKDAARLACDVLRAVQDAFDSSAR